MDSKKENKEPIELEALTLVPTPIGNLADITLRALEVLKTVDLIACEDTRHSKRLLNHYEINKPLISVHEHNEEKRIPELLAELKAGKKIALVSDAGMPAVSDPGYRLLQATIQAELSHTVLPGASSVMTALVGSGLAPLPFSFYGFLPVKKGKRLKALEAGLSTQATSIFFESPHRLKSTLEILNEHHPEASICVARELTKKFETYHRGSSHEVYDYFQERSVKGEIVLLLYPAEKC